jgi:photosystem II stability/assembly factor-like uncharacterized protein
MSTGRVLVLCQARIVSQYLLGETSFRCFNRQHQQMKTLLLAAIFCCGIFAMVNFAFGQTWVPTSAPITNWVTVASSADGNNLVAASRDMFGSSPGLLYTSTNSGLTWMSNLVSRLGFSSVASSADGSILVAAPFAGGIYVSTNGGSLWTQPTNVPSLTTLSVASSANGTIMYEVYVSGSRHFFVSTNAGATWTSNNMPSPLLAVNGIASSSDGTKLVAVANKLYTSTNSGITWISNNVPDEFWTSVASSADGKILTAVCHTVVDGPVGEIFTSTNFGDTWTQDNAPNSLLKNSQKV